MGPAQLRGPGCLAGAAQSAGRYLGSGVECLRVEAPKIIPRKGVSRNEKFISKECVKSTALIM